MNNRVNVDTVGHIDHTKRHVAQTASYRLAFGKAPKCSCMTKTPDITYHAIDCNYRRYAEGYVNPMIDMNNSVRRKADEQSKSVTRTRNH